MELLGCSLHSSTLFLLAASAATAAADTGSVACAACHAAIYKSYIRTPMAMSSGRVDTSVFQEQFNRNEFSHAPSGVRYRVYREGKDRFFEFDLSGTGPTKIHGSRRLEYFIGSGTVGRSYLLSVDGFLYQMPVSYYSAESKWDLSPGYRGYDHLYLTRPVNVACLQCHASRLQPSANGFAKVPFLEGGVGCERCHGDGEGHPMNRGSGIVNPVNLTAKRRDSVCEQCHLSGVARVSKAGLELRSFRPGDLLSDSASVFVRSAPAAGVKATSHVEKLAGSRCKEKSGDRLWCGSCHDPHSVPTSAGKAAYFRNKCLECHATKACKAAPSLRLTRGDNCIECHMPKTPAIDVEHAVFTDHSIPRRAAAPNREAPEGGLVAFESPTASDRDLGLAYAMAAADQPNPSYENRAFELLKTAAAQRPDDLAVLLQLAHLYDRRSEEDKAVSLYETVLRGDPNQVTAAVNLGAALVKRGRAVEAMRLWADALTRNPGLEVASVNLAMAQYRAGEIQAAQATLVKALELDPGATLPRRLLNQYRRATP